MKGGGEEGNITSENCGYNQPNHTPDSLVLSAPQEDGHWSGKHCTAAC